MFVKRHTHKLKIIVNEGSSTKLNYCKRMSKKIITTTILLCTILLFALSASCNQSADKKKGNTSNSFVQEINEQQIISGEEWLRSIFLCDNGKGYCFPDEEKVTTKRYYQYFIETIGIYEYPMFETEDERIVAEKAYKDRWKDIYPLDEEMSYPFGRGNGTEAGQKLENVIITPKSPTNFTVLIDFGDEIKVITDVMLKPIGNSYLVDYMKTIP